MRNNSEKLKKTDFHEMLKNVAKLKNPPVYLLNKLKKIELDLSNTMKKCEAHYGHGNCENVWNVLSVKKCPDSYKRYGCCECNLPCPLEFGYTDFTN